MIAVPGKVLSHVLVLVDYILRITTVPVHDSMSIACWVNHSAHTYVCSCLVMSHPEIIMESIYVVVPNIFMAPS